MDIRNDIKYILAKEGYTLTRIAELMAEKTGYPYTVKSISGKLIRESITLKELLQIFEIIDYKLVPMKNEK
ncbi:hypothetical protein J6P92_03110 [bacterium]|nr:hypothetical protein [bacterium]